MNTRIVGALLIWSLAAAATAADSTGAPTDGTLTLTAEQLLANDRPGPPNEAAQTLTFTGVRTSSASHGAATFANGEIHYTPDSGFFGSATLFYTACDNGATNGHPDPRCSEGTITINVIVNRRPAAASQTFTIAEEGSTPVTLTATDADGDAIAFRIVTPPSHGALSGTVPNLTYSAAPNFHGVDTFVFAANDGQDESAPATVTITVTEVNDPPVAQVDTTTAGAGKPVTVQTSFLLANDVAGPFDEANQTLTVTTVTAGAATHGTVSLAAGVVTFVPDPAYVGAAVIDYTVCDNGTTNGLPAQLCTGSTLTVVLNGPPAAHNQAVETVRTTPVPVTLTATDPEGDALTFTVVSGPQHGTLSGTPPSLTYVAAAGYFGNDSFTFNAKDAYSTSGTATVSIVIKDLPPVALGADSLTVVAGDSALVDVLANDVAGTGAMKASTLAIAAPPSHGTATVESGKIRYAANAGFNGADAFSYTACDDAGACGTALVTVTVTTNHPPTAVADSYTMDAETTLDVAAPGLLANDTDADTGDRLQARLGTGVHAGNLLLRSDGSFRYTPSAGFGGLDSFTYFVLDNAGAQSPPVTVSIDVIPVGPLAEDDTYETTRDNPLTVLPPGVLANDRDAHSTAPLTAKLDRAATRGVVDLNPNGSFVYTPDPGFVGTDTFHYVATDLPGLVSAPAFVTIHVTAPPGPVPTVTCVAPADGSRVTAPVAVTANVTPPAGETIAQWTVTARNTDRGTPVVLAAGSGSPPSPLATFDPTTLVNGGYEILTTAVSSGGGATTCTSDVFVVGDMKLGDYKTTYLDMETSIAGFPVQVLRTYDTTDKRLGDFGVGWTLELSGPRATPNNRLGLGGWFTEPFGQPFTRFRFKTNLPHFVTVTSPGGRVEVFDFTPPPTGPLLALTTPAFTARAGTGTTSTLEDVDAPTLSLAGDSLADFFGGTIYDPRLFRLTTKDGVVMIIDRFDGLQSITDRNGNQLVFSPNGVTSASTTRQLTFERDGAGRIIEIGGPGGKRTQYAYSLAGDLSQFVDTSGAAGTFAYDAGHRLLSADGPGGTRLRTFTYGADGRLTSLTDGAGVTTTLSSDVNARSEVVTSPSGRLTTVSTYGVDGNLASKEEVFSGHSRVTSYEYDSEGRRTRTTAPLGRVETLTYNAAGNLTSRTTPKNETWSYTYNALNKLTLTTAPDGAVVESLGYDAKGNLTSATLKNGKNLALTNDASGRPVTVSDGFGTTTYAYDADGQLTTATDAAGGVARNTYDAAGRVASAENAAGEVTHFTWTAFDAIAEITAANGAKQTLSYNAFGRLIAARDTANRLATYTYDAAGRMVTSVDRANRTTTYGYDQDGNLATVDTADGDRTTIVSDPTGRKVSVGDGDTIVESTYDDADDLLSERTRGNGGVALPDVTLSYTYDADGNRTGQTGPGGHVDYAYDGHARLVTVRDDAARTFTLTYDVGNDRLIGLARPNGVNDTLTYRDEQLTSRNALRAGAGLGRADYTLDAIRRKTSLTDLDGAHSFTHSLANRLIAAAHPAASGLAAESFAYDNVDNRTAWVGSPAGTVSYDAAMQLLSDGTYDYSYDAEGRLTERRHRANGGITRYTWNDAGQLTSVTTPSGAVSRYRYDPWGRRVEADDNGTIRRFVYSDQNLSNEFDGTNALRASYVTGVYPDTVYEIVRAGTRYYPLFDGIGSVTALTDDAGAIAGRVRYSAFGVPSSTGIADGGFTFTGHQYDSATGLVYARARYYDPTVGRFLSQDPDAAINPYAYVSNAPLEYTDPTGRSLVEYILNWFKKNNPKDEDQEAAEAYLQKLEKEGFDTANTTLKSTGERTPIPLRGPGSRGR